MLKEIIVIMLLTSPIWGIALVYMWLTSPASQKDIEDMKQTEDILRSCGVDIAILKKTKKIE